MVNGKRRETVEGRRKMEDEKKKEIMYGMKGLVSAALIVSIGLLAGCGRKAKEVAAVVNGKKILVSEFKDKLSRMPAYFQQNDIQRRKFLESLIDREILLAEARRKGLAKNKAVKDRLNIALDQILIEELVKTAVPEITVNDETLQRYYETNKGTFIEPEKVRVSQILIRSAKEGADILKQLKEGKDFEALARTKSISPDASRGGDIGFFGRGEMLPEFEKAAFSLQKGEISSIIKSPFGYHILKVTDKKEKRQKSFSEAKEEIKAILRQKQQREDLDAWFKELKKKAKIKINEEFLAPKPEDESKDTAGEQKQ